MAYTPPPGGCLCGRFQYTSVFPPCQAITHRCAELIFVEICFCFMEYSFMNFSIFCTFVAAVPFFAGRGRGLFRRPGRFLAKFSSRIRFSNLHWAVLLNLHGAQAVKGKGGASHCTVRADLQITVNHYNKSHTPFLGRPGRPFSKPRPACRALLDVPI